MLHGINLEVAAEWNRRLVLQILRKQGERTRRDLAAMTGLSMPAIANITGLLAEDGFIRESGRTKNGRGQPAIRLQLVEDYAIFLGVDVYGAKVRFAAVNVAGQVVHRNIIHQEVEERSHLPSMIAQVLAQGDIGAEKVLGVAVAHGDGVGISARTLGPTLIASFTRASGGGGDRALLDDQTVVSWYEALATIEGFGHGDRDRRFAYVHLSDRPTIVTATGRLVDHFHIQVQATPPDAMSNITADEGHDSARSPEDDGALADCALSINNSLDETYGKSTPGTVYVGGYLCDMEAEHLAEALSRLRGGNTVVIPATDPEYAVAIGAAMMLIDRRFEPQGVVQTQSAEVDDVQPSTATATVDLPTSSETPNGGSLETE